MPFQRIETGLPGLCILEPKVFGDARGYFKETYNLQDFLALGITDLFVQDNLSYSQYGTVRGLHFQAPPFAQAKLVSVVKGKVLDVVVDLRKSSPTFGQKFSVELSDENHRLFYVPTGFAHGFSVLSPDCIFAYKVTNLYNKASEGGLLWNDPDLGIDWGVREAILSEKDRVLPRFKELDSPFV